MGIGTDTAGMWSLQVGRSMTANQDAAEGREGLGGVPRPRWQVVDAGGETVYLGRDLEAAYRVYGDLPRGRLFQARPPSVRSVAR
jgi:hypothetical protein